MPDGILHEGEPLSNAARDAVSAYEPRALRTYTPTQAVLARSAGVFHWTPEGRRLYDFTSGVLVANLGHNPVSWLRRLHDLMGWSGVTPPDAGRPTAPPEDVGFVTAPPLTAYNALTALEAEASRRLVALLQAQPGGRRLEQVMWAASGSEAVQKALWAALARDRKRDVVLATRHGFHGKKGLAGAVTGCETDAGRDPRVRFVRFPMGECADVSMREGPFDPAPYAAELRTLKRQLGPRLGVLITEPYLGGGGSYHPPERYLHLLQEFCRANDIVFLLDEVQSNFGRTGRMFAFEAYGLEPDVVVLGKGLGNGVPVSAAAGRADLFRALDYGEASDTWSGNPLACAAVLATLDEFTCHDVLGACHRASPVVEAGLLRLRELPFIAHVRGERGGMVWGVETGDHGGRSAAAWANLIVKACYLGEPGGDGIHLLGPLAKKVIRVAPPLVITPGQAAEATALMGRLVRGMVAA
jgi:4-aminobutyrate aminotransferase-like enzyme